MKKATCVVAALALLLANGVAAHARRVRGECTNASTRYQHAFTFSGRFNVATRQLRGQVTSAGHCPHGRLRASCTPAGSGNFYNCHGTVGRCQIDGPYYGSFPATYNCPDGTVGAFGW